ncbi:MAG: hypothetical protein HON04_11020 [Planctomicrobium sp.]|nr:hypothetical protein [Planctomicrobium sp.]
MTKQMNVGVYILKYPKLPVVLLVMLFVSGCQPSEALPKSETIEGDSLERIDFEKTAPSVGRFILQASENKTIGQPISEFGDLLSHADVITLSPSKKYKNYGFQLPLTESAIEANAVANSDGGMPYIVRMGISVELKSQTVHGVHILMLGL